eukprot:TRINITY_DN1397_c0_g2_i2.p1 TRINITY_DN1397_c0_g2~~TRINITY_DN1397_c0_g2_i2.p1  ORF type:complete len:628 (-),score=160.18 TRINITY_DN1397_c0_g2_i2:104-1987(-)
MRVKFSLPEGHKDDEEMIEDVGMTEEQILEQLIQKAGAEDQDQEYLEMSLQFIEDYAAEEARLREESEEIRRMEEQLARLEEELAAAQHVPPEAEPEPEPEPAPTVSVEEPALVAVVVTETTTSTEEKPVTGTGVGAKWVPGPPGASTRNLSLSAGRAPIPGSDSSTATTTPPPPVDKKPQPTQPPRPSIFVNPPIKPSVIANTATAATAASTAAVSAAAGSMAAWKLRQEEQRKADEEARKRRQDLEIKRREEDAKRKLRAQQALRLQAEEDSVKNKIQADYEARKNAAAAGTTAPTTTTPTQSTATTATTAPTTTPIITTTAPSSATTATPTPNAKPAPVRVGPSTRPAMPALSIGVRMNSSNPPGSFSPRPVPATGPVRPANNVSPSALRAQQVGTGTATPTTRPQFQRPASRPGTTATATASATPQTPAAASTTPTTTTTPTTATTPTITTTPTTATTTNPTTQAPVGILKSPAGASVPMNATSRVPMGNGNNLIPGVGPGAAPVQTRLRRATPPMNNQSGPIYSVLPGRSQNGSIFIRESSPFEDPVKRGVAKPAGSSPNISARASMFEDTNGAETEEEEARKQARRARLDMARGKILAKGKEDPTALLPKDNKPFSPNTSK